MNEINPTNHGNILYNIIEIYGGFLEEGLLYRRKIIWKYTNLTKK